MDERFFIYCEEPDLCLRIKQAGWEVRHLPPMTIIHHAGKGGVRPKMAAQDAYTRMQYAQSTSRRSIAWPIRPLSLRDARLARAARATAGRPLARAAQCWGATARRSANRRAKPFARTAAADGAEPRSSCRICRELLLV